MKRLLSGMAGAILLAGVQSATAADNDPPEIHTRARAYLEGLVKVMIVRVLLILDLCHEVTLLDVGHLIAVPVREDEKIRGDLYSLLPGLELSSHSHSALLRVRGWLARSQDAQ